MFEEIHNSASRYMSAFHDCVKDEFGMSIIHDVLEPMLAEIAGLIQMDETMEGVIREVMQLTEELQAIGKYANE